jgi:RNA polymerase sigma-70 factor (ECF subfamily)
MIGERAAAEDVTQETFLALLEFPGRFDAGVGTFRTFLYAIARNVCRKRLKKMRPEEDLDFDGEWLGADSFDRVAGLEEEKAVREAVAALPALQREVVFLFEYEDLSLSETAIAAGADVNTVKARLHRARQRLKKDLSWMKT